MAGVTTEGDPDGLSQEMMLIIASARTGEDDIASSRLAAGGSEESREGRVGLVWMQ